MYKRKTTTACTEDDQKFDPASGRGPACCRKTRNHTSKFPIITTKYVVDSCSIVPPRLTYDPSFVRFVKTNSAFSLLNVSHP